MTHEEEIVSMANKLGVIRPRDIRAPRAVLAQLVEQGVLERSGRGLYRISSLELSEHHSLVEVSAKIPHAVVSHLSALQFHGNGTQNPSEVWITIDIRARKPNLENPPIRVMRASGKAFTSGIVEHTISGRKVRVYCLEKTIVDCFKYRSKVGLDVALEALKDAWHSKKINTDLLWRHAKVCRITNVIRPYLEALQ